MEFPDLGEHCSLKECRQLGKFQNTNFEFRLFIYSFSYTLDFLPIKCSSCKQIFCSNHFRFEAHHCPVASEDEQNNANQSPVCPLCNRPVSIKAGESADFKVSEHIDKNCASEEREQVFKNRCSRAGCKKRELMPLTCESCRLNHCLSHRHPTDHQCQGPPKRKIPSSSVSSGLSKGLQNGGQLLHSFTARSASAYENLRSSVANTFSQNSRPNANPAAAAAAAAASARAAGANSNSNSFSRLSPVTGSSQGNLITLQGNLSEEEALNIAIQESLATSSPTGSQSTTLPRSTSNADQKCHVS